VPQKSIRILLLVCALTGCATQQETSAVECGAGGAVLAVVICKMAHGNDASCAAIGAGAGAAGAAICYSYANNIQKRRQALAAQGDTLNAHLKYLQGVNQDTATLNSQLAAKVTAVTNSTDQAVNALAKGQMTQAELAHQRQALDAQVTAAQAQVNTATQELQSARQYRAQQGTAPSPALDAEIARLQELLSQAQSSTSALAAQRQRI
jgi:septal ring factor EnvC (AmiA/AmiB activator)